jgi:hypothetical protein
MTHIRVLNNNHSLTIFKLWWIECLFHLVKCTCISWSTLKNTLNAKWGRSLISTRWLTYVSLVFIVYQFIYNPRVKSIKMLIFFENPLIPSSIHIYHPFFSLLQIQWEPRPVLTRKQSKNIKILIFLFTSVVRV